MNLWTKIGYGLVLGLFKILGFLPAWFLYGVVGSCVYFTMYHISRYRVKVVRQNLSASFPEKSREELRSIERGFYRHLAEVAVDTIAMASVGKKRIGRRLKFENTVQMDIDNAGRSWLGALAHYGSWEYFVSYNLYTEKQVKAVYKPLHNKVFDRYYNYMRSRFGMIPVAMHDILKTVVADRRYTSETFVYGIIGDQTPPRAEQPHWFEFLGRKTAFFMGIEKLALKFGMPVYFVNVEKKGHLRYTARFDLIYDPTENVAPGEITERYVRMLEKKITDRPELWMWSHRRWKHKPDA